MVTRWTARLRDPDLNLLDEVEFATGTLVRTYNAPATLAITGRLDVIRSLLRPGHGILARNSAGQAFSGRLVQATRRGTGQATAMYVGDTVRLWDRICYPNTNLAWDSQISDRDIATGTSEARIISLVNRNAGPGAWHSTITGTDPGSSTTFTPWKTIVPDTRTRFIHSVMPDPAGTDMYLFQSSSTHLYAARLDTTGVQQSIMTLPKGGNAELAYLTVRTLAGKRTVYLTYRYSMAVGSRAAVWVQVPYIADKVWTAAAVLALKVAEPRRTKMAVHANLSGEVNYGTYTFRLYGTPYDNSGSTVSPAVPAYIEVIQANKVVRTIPAGQLGRGGDNLPYDARLEPEGLAVVSVSGQPSLLVGFTTGTSGTYASRLYTVPIKPKPRAAEDRRVPNLVMPTNLGRGVSGTTTTRSDQLGPIVAALAEAADLALSIDWAYDPTDGPYLQFNITETPDLSDVVRAAGAGPGSGPVTLGEDWLYSDGLATATTILSRAGGLGSDRIVRYSTNSIVEDLWDVRVEGFLDNSGLTDLSEIDDGIAKALADAAGPSEVAAPIGSSDLEWGVDIPLGAKIAAVLDGQPIIDRVRQITWTIQNTPSDPTTSVQAVLGSPDAALKTPTQKQLAAMLRRLTSYNGR